MTPHRLRHAGRDWPVVDGIPFLRTGREALADAALERLGAGDREGALVLLLADQDDWWDGPPPAAADLHLLVREHARLSLRAAMSLLAWGRVGDYFAHRWSDPTFLAGLALVEAHWTAPRSAFELACGIGHHLRELARRGVAVAGADVVFAKLWVARHWVCPEAALWCLDAAAPWPEMGRFDLACCHDAFYFLEPKGPILQKLRALAPVRAVGHVHNRGWAEFSAGAAVSEEEMRALFPGAALYDDAELTRAAASSRAPVPGGLAGAEAFSAVEGDPHPARPVRGLLALPPEGARLRRNPLYDRGGRLAWPSPRYRREYAPRATFPPVTDAPARAVLGPATAELARRRELLDLPERW